MQNSPLPADLTELEKKAVKSAVAGDWNTAKEYNSHILVLDPDNLDAKTRLGKAYLELRDYAKAKKYFKEVLAVDPINSIALKNYSLAKEEKHLPQNTATSIIKEPATYQEVTAQITARGYTAAKIPMGAPLEIKILASQIKIYYITKNQRVDLATITDPTVQRRLKAGKDMGSIFSAVFVRGTDKEITVLVGSSLPIFKGEKQELKPYTKRDLTEGEGEPEPALEEN